MRDPNRVYTLRSQPPESGLRPEWGTPARTAFNIYATYLMGLVFPIGLPMAFVIALVKRRSGPDWVQTHYRFQLRTFWLALAALAGIFVAAKLGVAFVDSLIPMWASTAVFVVWYFLRNVRGMELLQEQAAHPRPTSWLF